MQRFCLALDLKPDPALIETYEKHHDAVWPEVEAGLRRAGITSLEIYRVENRLFMILEAGDDFTFERKAEMDAGDERIQAWETLMWQYQQALPTAAPGEKWVLMNRIYQL